MYLDENGIAHIEDTDPVSPLSSLINPLQAATSEAIGNLMSDTGWIAGPDLNGFTNEWTRVRVMNGLAILVVDITATSTRPATLTGLLPSDPRWAWTGGGDIRFELRQTGSVGGTVSARVFNSGQVNVYGTTLTANDRLYGTGVWPVG